MLLLHPRPAPPLRTSSWLLAVIPRRPGRRCRRPTKARPQRLGHDLDHRPGAAVLGRPAPLRKSAHDFDPAAPAQRFGRMLRLVAPHDHGEERRRTTAPAPADPTPPPGTRPRRSRPRCAAAPRVVGEVAGKAHAGLGHAASRAVCPALGPGDGGHCGMPREPQGQATEPTKSAMDQAAEHGRLRCRVGWWSACGWGSGMPAPSGQIPPPWAWWENEAPTTRAAGRPGSGSFPR